MKVPALGEAARQLPWLSPCAASLLALARAPAGTAWLEIRHDPAALLLVLRCGARALTSPALSFFPSVLRDPAILRGALKFLALDERRPPGRSLGLSENNGRVTGSIDWSRHSNQQIYRACLAYARAAQRVAESTGRCDPDNAWVAAFLAPLGWLAVCAVDPDQAAACLADTRLAHDPDSTEQLYWGSDQDAIARKLSRRWRLPRWLSAIIGHLGLSAEIAQDLGAEPALFQAVQLAVRLVQRQGPALCLRLPTAGAEIGAASSVPAPELEKLASELEAPASPPAPISNCVSPPQIPLLGEILRLAVENQELREAPILEQLESERDQFQHCLERQQAGEAERLRTRKLMALAEFAAGAAHEINNPLAVISGQAQYLMGHDSDPDRQRALQTIINQTQRIHQVLCDLLQFARPSRPQRQLVDVRALFREEILSLGDLAAEKEVRLISTEPEHGLQVYADPRQLRTALDCLLRNAIEAAPVGGWANLRMNETEPDRVEFVVEDNGTGPSDLQREHLFDPFYSGRQAGRGRGLGLPTAWRLAREHGGDVRLDENVGGPTRFILTLPRRIENNGNIVEACIPEATSLKRSNGSPVRARADL